MLSKQDKVYIKSQTSMVQTVSNGRFSKLEASFSKLEADNHKTHILLEDIRSNLIKALGEGYDALYDQAHNHENRITRLEKRA